MKTGLVAALGVGSFCVWYFGLLSEWKTTVTRYDQGPSVHVTEPKDIVTRPEAPAPTRSPPAVKAQPKKATPAPRTPPAAGKPTPGAKVKGIMNHITGTDEIVVPTAEELALINKLQDDPSSVSNYNEISRIKDKSTYYLGGSSQEAKTCFPFDREGNFSLCPDYNGQPKDNRSGKRAWTHSQQHHKMEWYKGMKNCKNKPHPYAPVIEGGQGLDPIAVSQREFPEEIVFY